MDKECWTDKEIDRGIQLLQAYWPTLDPKDRAKGDAYFEDILKQMMNIARKLSSKGQSGFAPNIGRPT